MLVEESFSREMLYFAVSIAATGFYSLMIASASLIGVYQDARSSYQKFILAGILMVAVILLSWLKNRFQQIIDLRYFRGRSTNWTKRPLQSIEPDDRPSRRTRDPRRTAIGHLPQRLAG